MSDVVFCFAANNVAVVLDAVRQSVLVCKILLASYIATITAHSAKLTPWVDGGYFTKQILIRGHTLILLFHEARIAI